MKYEPYDPNINYGQILENRKSLKSYEEPPQGLFTKSPYGGVFDLEQSRKTIDPVTGLPRGERVQLKPPPYSVPAKQPSQYSYSSDNTKKTLFDFVEGKKRVDFEIEKKENETKLYKNTDDSKLSVSETLDKYSNLLNDTNISKEGRNRYAKQGIKTIEKLLWESIANDKTKATNPSIRNFSDEEKKAINDIYYKLKGNTYLGSASLGAAGSFAPVTKGLFWATQGLNKDYDKTEESFKKGDELLKNASSAQPIAYMGGNMVGQAAQYGVVSPAVTSLPGVGALAKSGGAKLANMTGGKIAADVGTRLVAGRIADIPLDVVNAWDNSGGDVYKFVQNLGADIALGTIFDGALEGVGHLVKKVRAGGKLSAVEEMQLSNTLNENVLALPEPRMYAGDKVGQVGIGELPPIKENFAKKIVDGRAVSSNQEKFNFNPHPYNIRQALVDPLEYNGLNNTKPYDGSMPYAVGTKQPETKVFGDSSPFGVDKKIDSDVFADVNNPLWRNVDYSDETSKKKITIEVMGEMLKENQIVKISADDLGKFNEYFPDLRRMKSKDRQPILRQKITALKKQLESELRINFKNKDIEFEINGNILEARLYDTGIKEVMDNITKEKATMLTKSEEIFKKARYLYSVPDKRGNNNVFRWNYFYAPLEVDGELMGVRIAVRDMADPKESQIYHWGIKKEVVPAYVSPGQNLLDTATSNYFFEDSIANDMNTVNNSNMHVVGDYALPRQSVGLMEKPKIYDGSMPYAVRTKQPETKVFGNSSPFEVGKKNAKTSINTSITGKTPKEIKILTEYVKSIDDELFKFVEESKKNTSTTYKRYPICDVNTKQARSIEHLTGIDVSDYKNSITNTAINHINKRHGVNGIADSTMQFSEDIARIPYILENYDKAELVLSPDGKQEFSKWVRDKNNKPAPLVMFSKQVDGTLYVVQAVPDNKYKTMWVETAYINKKEASQVLNMVNTPQQTSETPHAAASNSSIANDIKTVNNSNMHVVGDYALPRQSVGLMEKPKIYDGSMPYAVRTKKPETKVFDGSSPFGVGTDIGNVEKATQKANSIEIVNKLKKSIPELKDMPVVTKMSGEEFPKSDRKLTEQVGDFFRSLGNKVHRVGFGDVIMDNDSIKSDIGHGLGRAKSITFMSVPDVIKNGKQIDFQTNWKGRGYDSYVFAAPVEVENKKGYVAVIVLKSKDNRFYVHEAVDELGNVIYINKKEPDIIKTRVTTQGGVTSESGSYNNIISDDINNVNNSNMQGVGDYADESIFGKNTVGAAEHNPNTIESLIHEHGAIPKGTQPRGREIEVPRKNLDGKTINYTIRTVMEAPQTPDEMIRLYEDMILEGQFAHTVKSDKSSIRYATDYIEKNDYAKAVKKWFEIINSGESLSKDNIVLGQMLYTIAAKNNDFEVATGIVGDLSAEMTKIGQGLQAQTILKKQNPDGQLYYAMRSVENINKDIQKVYDIKDVPKDLRKKIEIDKNLFNAFNEAGIKGDVELQKKYVYDILVDAAQQVPSTLADKWNAWRYLSMLGNPKTHIRNVVGNALFYTTVKVKNIVGAGIEGVTDNTLKFMGKNGINRTKTISFIPQDIKKFVTEDFEQMADVLSGGGKYNPDDIIKQNKKVFDNKFLESIRKLNSNLLEAEDKIFLKANYTDSLGKYMTANNLSPSSITEKQLNIARTYAINEAQKATFRDASKVAMKLNSFANTNSFTKVMMGGIMPFTKTPINILKRGVEYSPIGVLKGIKQVLFDVRKGTKTASEAIDSLASGLTGSGIAAFGWLLAKNGILTAGNSDDKKQNEFDKNLGVQNYALNIGDSSYTIDWAAPFAIPLFIGAEVANLKEVNSIGDSVDLVFRLSDPMFEMSMLQGLNSTIKTAGYSDNPLGEMAMNVVSQYASQAVPTMFGQIARSVDDTRRTTYVEKGDSKVLSSTLQRAQAKIPFLSNGLMPKINMWGEEVKNEGDNFLSRLAYNTLSPGYYSKKETSSTENELMRLYNKGVENNPYPTKAPKSFIVNKDTVYLSSEDYEIYAKIRGQLSKKYVDSTMTNSYYKNLNDEDKAEVINDLYLYSNAIAKSKVSSYEIDGTYKKMFDAEKKGIPPQAYLIYKKMADADNDGKVTIEEFKSLDNKSSLSKNELATMYEYLTTGKNNPYLEGEDKLITTKSRNKGSGWVNW